MLALATTAPARAQMPQQRMVRIGFGGGVTVPVSAAGDAWKSGFNGQGFLLVHAGGIPLRFNLGYQKFDFEEAVLGGGATGESTMLSGVAGVSFDLVKAGPLTPYITAGLGAFSLKDEISSGQFSGETSNTRFGIDGGAGIRLRLGCLEGFVEGRIQNIYRRPAPSTRSRSARSRSRSASCSDAAGAGAPGSACVLRQKLARSPSVRVRPGCTVTLSGSPSWRSSRFSPASVSVRPRPMSRARPARRWVMPS
jgi:hypothetical protein